MLVIAAACTSTPAQSAGAPADQSTTGGLALYLTESFNGAGRIAVDPMTLQDRSTKPLLAISPTAARKASAVASLDGSAIAVMNYQDGTPGRGA